MKKIFVYLIVGLVVSACGVKQAPVSPDRPPLLVNLDCSIYDPDCSVQDPKYDPACDPALSKRPAICEIWNQKYQKAREEYLESLQEDYKPKSKSLTPNNITP
jgi:hypothetical protein